jgi:hypothetical protein
VTDLEPRALTLKDTATAVTITDHATHQAAVELGLGIKALRDEAEAHHRPVIDAAHKAHKAALAALQRIDGPLAEAQRILGAKVTAYQRECQRIEREETARRQREENERAEKEAQQAALDAIDQGASMEEVEAIAVPVPMPVVAPPAPKVSGISKPTPRYSCEVTDQKLLPEEYKIPNQTLLDSLARSLKTLFKVPGCKLVTTYGASWTGRK